MHTSVTSSPDYTRKIYNPDAFGSLARRMVTAARAIKKISPFSMIAGCGNSGLPLLGVMGLRLRLPILACRKKADPCHDVAKVNGHFVQGKYLIIDDLISSGHTVDQMRRNILAEVADQHEKEYKRESQYDSYSYKTGMATWLPQCAGILLYQTRYSPRVWDFCHTPPWVDGKPDCWGPTQERAHGPEVAEQVPVYFIGDYSTEEGD